MTPYVESPYLYSTTSLETTLYPSLGVSYVPGSYLAGASTSSNLWDGQGLLGCYSEPSIPDVVFDVSDNDVAQAVDPRKLLSHPIESGEDVYCLDPDLCQVNLPFLSLYDKSSESGGVFRLGTSRPSPP